MEGESGDTGDARTESGARFERYLARSVSVPLAIAVGFCAMAAFAFVVNVLNVPNPNMVLVSCLVICSAIFGYAGSIPAAAVMLFYTFWFFSIDNSFTAFTDQNLQKIVISAIGITVVTVFVSTLRSLTAQAFARLAHANKTLEENNHLLEEASAVDSLTGTRNRFGLRCDFPNYLDKEIYVMMIDIDDFKSLNDNYGHYMGDFVLNQLGSCLVELFRPEHVYRYGGDEFLIVCPKNRDGDFEKRTKELKIRVSGIQLENSDARVNISGGYVYGTPAIESDLRFMIRQADGNLYTSKGAGKNRVIGCAYSRLAAENTVLRKATTQVTTRYDPYRR